ncbi:MAG: riboflavin synthase [Acidimicrobiia bacterium]
MFTGIVEELGRVVGVAPNEGGVQMTIEAITVLDDTEVGASIALNGCCLTVVALDERSWSADVVIETLARTNLGDLTVGDAVNLERPVRLTDRLGGHLVQGHVDATGAVRDREPQPDGSAWITIGAPPELLRYVVHKGSITVDGVSLTVARRDDDAFSVALIPHTLVATTLGTCGPNSRVNLEADLIAKYVEALLAPGRLEATP